jgi:putative acetyltransferase
MALEPLIRPESTTDADAITAVTIAAFQTLEICQHTERFIVKALRTAGALAVSLVAELDGQMVGHVAFSPVTLSDGTPGWYGLGPVSVLPAYLRQGMGEALIREGQAQLQAMGARGCCLVGHADYSTKFGFRHPDQLVHPGLAPEYFLALSFDAHGPRGTVAFHARFGARIFVGPAACGGPLFPIARARIRCPGRAGGESRRRRHGAQALQFRRRPLNWALPPP